MSGEPRPPIVIRRVRKRAGGHGAAAWKIAYADFVTAMMAFFLLMWLLGSTTKGELEGIAEYFKTPLKVALAGGSGSGDSSAVIQGGGTDISRSNGQVKMGDKPPEKRTINLQAAQALVEQQERARLGELKRRLEAAIDANPTLRNFKRQLRIDLVPDGLRIQIVDEQNRPMFDTGSAVLRDYTRDILREVAQALNDVPNRISLSGHTDAARYAGGERGYSNWELSADRANASRRELIAGGIADDKIVRVMGLGAAIMQNGDDPLDPVNRRIGIVVLNHKAEERILHEGLPAAPPAAATADAPPPSGETTVPSPPSGVAATRDSVRASQ